MQSGHGGNIQEVCSLYDLEPGGLLDFSANINPEGYPPALPNAIIKQGFASIRHYPDINCTELRCAIAQKTRHKKEEILVGNGSTEFMYLLPRTFHPAKGIVFQPTYSDYGRALRLAGAMVEELMSTEEDSFAPDLNNPLLSRNQPQMVFLCNPNNPTGNLVEKEEILALAEDLPKCLIVVDEAFMDFVDEPHRYTVMPEAGKVKNLIVLRSMTKFFGFPGLRLGYMVTHPSITRQIEEKKEPWTVNALAQLAGLVALVDEDFMFRSREYVASEKMFLYKELFRLDGIKPIPPTVNFITSKIVNDSLTAAELKDMLIRKGLLIRDCSNFPGLDASYFRVAVRRREENLMLLQSMEAVLKERMDGLRLSQTRSRKT
jgi:threonine-phosphate decarboxylase